MGIVEPKSAQNYPPNAIKKPQKEKEKINSCTLETQMSKYKRDFKRKGNLKIRIKTPVRTKLKKSSFLENTVVSSSPNGDSSELLCDDLTTNGDSCLQPNPGEGSCLYVLM